MALLTPIQILDFNAISYSARGNTFIVAFDEKDCYQTNSQFLCQSFDVDGLITLKKENNHFFMRIFNKDGSEATMCGNGLMCAMHYLVENGFSKPNLVVKTLAATYKGQVNKNLVTIDLPFAKICSTTNFGDTKTTLVDSGTLHALIEVEDINDVDMELAKTIRFDTTFCTFGCNVTFFQKVDFGAYARTYEKGVENETKACGTGAYAVAWYIFSSTEEGKLKVIFPDQTPLIFEKEKNFVKVTGDVCREAVIPKAYQN